MRLLKLKLVLAILLFAFTINAQDIILEEGFNTGSIPTGWTEAFETGSYEAHWEPGHVGGTNDFPAYTHSGDYNLKALKYTSSTTSTSYQAIQVSMLKLHIFIHLYIITSKHFLNITCPVSVDGIEERNDVNVYSGYCL